MQEREPAVAVAPATPATADASTGLDADVPSVPDSDGAVPGLQPADDTSAGNDVGDTIRVRTDVLDVLIATRGGDLVRADLLTYPVEKSNPDVVIRLLDYAPATRWVFQTGLRDAADGPEPNHLAPFKAEQSDYVLGPDQSSLTVTLTWAEDSSLAVTKNYTFRRGDYGISLDIDVTNNGAAAWTGVGYTQMLRRHDPLERSFMSVDSYSFTGPVLYDGDSYEKLDFDELVAAPQQQTLPNGWYAAIQHHFLAAAVPPPEDETSYEAVARGEEFRLRAVSPPLQVPPAGDLRYSTALFVGPKLQSQLAEISEDLRLTVDYGLLTPIAKPLFWLLSAVHDYVGNWGFAIILVTMLIKLAFYKLTAMSGRSMAKMRKLQPRMKTLQERYKDDRQGLGQAMMELYKREKVNPAAGCLPMVIQMPFFFAFYWVLVESVEMRQAPFMLWINDLSVRDPFFVLPLLMGAAMLFQQRLNPAPPDPVQAKVMQIMPIVFTGMFAFFPAGLVLYWLTNTATSIAQQWRINTLVEREG
jgi:YidC/Oxa1 family membrane protein insertase